MMKQLEIPDEELVMNWSNDQVTAKPGFGTEREKNEKSNRLQNGIP